MAQIDTGGGGKKGGKVRSKKMSTRIDLTPMVDLGFLLITFFMLTTTLAKPQALPITLPEKPNPDDPVDTTKVKDTLALTVILTADDKIYYYEGIGSDDVNIQQTSFDTENGIRQVLRRKNSPQISKIEVLRNQLKSKEIDAAKYKEEVIKIKGGKTAMFVFVKADEKATYKNLIDMLDELLINQVGKYAIVDVDPKELEMINGTGAPAETPAAP